MPTPTLTDLPAPPPNRIGWPWTVGSPFLPPTQPNGLPWPRISIVTPSYNQGQYLEETLRSVLLQGYPNLEYFVMDGGSTDESRAILERYAPWLTHWESKRDQGQAHAINKGLARATGQIAAYLNSDDLYLQGALAHVGQSFVQRPFDVLVGRRPPPTGRWFLHRSLWRTRLQPFVYPYLLDETCRYELPQECVFWNHARYGQMRFNEQYHFCLDTWWFLQLFSDAEVVHTSRRVGWLRDHPASKSSRLQAVARAETARITEQAKAYTTRLTPAQSTPILAAYRRASYLALLRGPWRDHTFRYHHPPYRLASPTDLIPPVGEE